MQLVTLDYETFWSQEHSLSKMLPMSYVMHPETEIISCSVKVDNTVTGVYFGENEISAAFRDIDWADSFALAHNMSGFDAMIHAWRFGIKPKMWGCTLAMARPVHSITVGNSLKKLVEHYNLGVKDNTVLMNTKGRHLCDFTEQEIRDMAKYNKDDTDQCYALFQKLKPHFTSKELWHIDATIRQLVEPAFVVDTELLDKTLLLEQDRKYQSVIALAELLGLDIQGDTSKVEEQVTEQLMSAAKFSEVITARGVTVPTKPSPSNPDKRIPALAKTDPEFIALQDHEDPIVAAAANARLAVKSTILETRIEAFLEVAQTANGLLPIPINYCGAATTGRDSGWAYNPQNLPRILPSSPKLSDAMRNCMKAPEGHKVIVADLSGIELRVNMFLWKVPYATKLFQDSPDKADLYKTLASEVFQVPYNEVTKPQRQAAKAMHLGCFSADTNVLTSNGTKRIVDVEPTDLVWDGESWVQHRGLIYQGVKPTVKYRGVSATTDHEILTAHGWVEWGEVCTSPHLYLSALSSGNSPYLTGSYDATQNVALGFTQSFGALAGGKDLLTELRTRLTGGLSSSLNAALQNSNANLPVYDLRDCGPHNRFTILTDDGPIIVHNCGFGLGNPDKFVAAAKQLAQIDVTPEESAVYIRGYREKHPEIVQGWKTCHSSLLDIYNGDEVPIDPWGLCVTNVHGIRLPSGRLVRYPKLHVESSTSGREEWWYGEGRHRARIYAGKIDENIVQALARDVLKDYKIQFFRETGLRSALDVHDELVYVVPEDEAQSRLDHLQKIMRVPPVWWPELVTWSEGDIADTYGAAK